MHEVITSSSGTIIDTPCEGFRSQARPKSIYLVRVRAFQWRFKEAKNIRLTPGVLTTCYLNKRTQHVSIMSTTTTIATTEAALAKLTVAYDANFHKEVWRTRPQKTKGEAKK